MTEYNTSDIDFKEFSQREIYILLSHLCPPQGYLVLPWDKAPQILKDVFCFNGGDEDWMIITMEDSKWIKWLDSTDSCSEPDVYLVEDIVVYIGSHA